MNRFNILKLLSAAFVLFLLLAFVFPQNFGTDTSNTSVISDSSSNGMRWRLVGPFRAGRALAASGVPSQPSTFYFGSVDGGVWKSTNAGLTWDPISDGQMNPSIGALAVAASNPNIIYVGTGEADMRSDITYGDGIYKSTDAGKHWQHLGLEDTRHIGKILIDPKNPNIVLAAALGHAYAPNNERGVFRTTNGGKTWEKVLYKNNKTGAIDLSWDTGNPDVVYASLWQAYRTPWSQYPPEEGYDSNIYKSTDDGKTWKEISGSGLPAGSFGRIGLSVVHSSNGEKVYALIQALKKGSGLYYSADGGMHWQLKSNNPQIITRMWYFGRIFVDPKNPDNIFIPNRSIFKSTDGGKTFTAIKGSPGGDDYHYLWIDPQNDNHLIEASDQGTCVSLDGGKTWSSWYNQPTAQFYHVAVNNEFPYRIYGAQQDCGSVSITSRSDYGEITFRDWHSVNAGESGYIAPDPAYPNIIYGGDTYGGLSRFNRITGQTQNISPSLLAQFGEPISKQKYRFTWTSPIIFDPYNHNSLYFGAQVLLNTKDGGLHWTKISPDLTRAGLSNVNTLQNEKGSGNTVADSESLHIGWGVIYSIAVSPVKAGIIWVGTDDGLIQLTKDYGKHWQNVTPPAITPWSKISILEASPFNSATVYAAVDRHRLNDFTPYIYRTTDFGKHWLEINKGIAKNSFVRVVRADPFKKGLLYAGTEEGVYVSFNDGENWQPLQLNLPAVSVRDLAVHDNDLIAATHGRAFWVLDDITPLRQMNEKILNEQAYLFRPEIAIRIRRSESHDTPLPPEIPHGENPPAGAIINYYLNSQVQSPVVLKILDQKGNLVRSFSSIDKPTMPLQQPYFMTWWLPKFKPLTTKAGLNRFVWNLRYASPPTKYYYYSIAAIAGKGTVREPQGPMVLPGRYTVKLFVNGKAYTQTLTVKMDPRVKVTNKALNDQLNLAVKIWNASSRQFNLANLIDTVDAQLKILVQNQKINEELKSNIKAAAGKVGKLDMTINRIGFAGLEGSVLSADREPAQQMVTSYNTLNEKFINVKKEWSALRMNDLRKLDELLNKSGVEELKFPVVKEKEITF